MRPKAYSYIRFSTPEQGKGDSFRRQVESSREYADDHDLELDEALTFRDLGVSAYDQSNLAKDGGLRQFLNAIESGAVQPGSYLLVESLDRISRAQVLDALETFLGILRRGINVVTMADGYVYSRQAANEKPFDLIISLTILSRAHEESLTKSKRLRAAWGAKRNNINNKKLTKICPAWLQLNESKTEYEILKDKAEIVLYIIRLVNSGMGRHAIVRKLNEAGTPSIGRRGKSGVWFESYITKIINNRALIGEFQPHKISSGKREPVGEPIVDYFPRLISDADFGLLQEKISVRGTRSGGNRGAAFSNLFIGMLQCGYCGGSMVYVNKGTSQKTGKNNRIVVCSRAKRGAGCHYVPWPYDDLEASVLGFIKGVDFSKFIREGAERKTHISSALEQKASEEAKREVLKNRRERLIAIIETDDNPPGGILERIKKIDQEISTLDQNIDEIEIELKRSKNLIHLEEAAIEGVHDLMKELDNSDGEDLFLLRSRLNEQLRHTIVKISLLPGGEIISPDEKNKRREILLKETNYSEAEIEAQLDISAPSEFRRADRMLIIRHRSGRSQIISPGKLIPDILAASEEHPELLKKWVERTRASRM